MTDPEINQPVGGDPDKPNGGPTPPPPPPAPPKTFTQAELEAKINERLAASKQSQKAKLEDLLGDVPEEDVRAILAAHKEREDSQKDEHTKAMEATAKAQRDAESATATAKRSTLRSNLTMALFEPAKDAEGNDLPPVNRDYLQAVIDLAMPLAEASEEDDPIADAVAQVRLSAAPMFTVPPSTDTNGDGKKKPAPTPQRKLGENDNGDPATIEQDAVDAYKALKGPRGPGTTS